MNIEQRQLIERQIAEKVIDCLFAAGYAISVFDGEEYPLKNSADKAAVLDAMFSTDEDILYAKQPIQIDGANKFKMVGWVQFVYGNDGYDVVADNTVNLEAAIAPATELADRIADIVHSAAESELANALLSQPN